MQAKNSSESSNGFLVRPAFGAVERTTIIMELERREELSKANKCDEHLSSHQSVE